MRLTQFIKYYSKKTFKCLGFFCLTFFIEVSTSIDLYSQDAKYQTLLSDVEWGEGTIILTNGKEQKGLVNYNDKKGIISFDSGSESKTLIPRQILGFEYIDQRVNQKRLFYSLEYEDETTTSKNNFIFEVLRAFKTFAVLNKVGPVEFKQKSNWDNLSTPGTSFGSTNTTKTQRNYTDITQRETVYLLPEDGKVTPILEMSFRQSEGRVIERSRTKNKFVNKEVFMKCIGNVYPELEAYAKKNGLQFDEKDDLMKMFDFYEQKVGTE